MEKVIYGERSCRKWAFFCGLADKGFGTTQLSKFYRKYKSWDLCEDDFDEIYKKTSKRKVFNIIKRDYFGKNLKMSEFGKRLRNTRNNEKSNPTEIKVETLKFSEETENPTPTDLNINLKIQKEIDDENVIAMCEKFLKSYLNHLVIIKNKLNETFYEMIKGNHNLLRKKIYVINVDKSWGKQNLICFDEKSNIYRVGSDIKIGNIKKDEYYFVRGRVAYYYIGEGQK